MPHRIELANAFLEAQTKSAASLVTAVNLLVVVVAVVVVVFLVPLLPISYF